ncbi:MAG: FMN-binding protein [Anaerovoracaceae bacterium]
MITDGRVPGKINKGFLVFVILLVVFAGAFLFLNGRESPEPSEAELSALNDIFGASYTLEDYTIITEELMTQERQEKFKAVKKIFLTPSGDYGFICKPVAYNGPVSLAVGIDGETDLTLGLRIVEHMETEHYVRDMNNSWFTDRFAGKTAENYLKTVKLDSRSDDEVVIITGATVTTDGIVNGVNACMGVYQEAFLGRQAEPVPYMVRFEREEGDGPEETGSVAIRAYGVVLGEVTLEEIQKMPSVKRTLSIHSTAGTTNHSFRGTLLSNVIAAVDPELLAEYEMVQPVGVDDYLSNISMDEVLAENAVYLMYEDNGELLPKKDGKPGAMRVVVLDDFFGQRFTNYLIEIVLE